MSELLNKSLPGFLHLKSVGHRHFDVFDEFFPFHILDVHHRLRGLHGRRGRPLTQSVHLVENSRKRADDDFIEQTEGYVIILITLSLQNYFSLCEMMKYSLAIITVNKT